ASAECRARRRRMQDDGSPHGTKAAAFWGIPFAGPRSHRFLRTFSGLSPLPKSSVRRPSAGAVNGVERENVVAFESRGSPSARCRTVQENGELGGTVRSTAYTGGTVNTLRTFDCKPVEVMVGYGGSQGDNGYVLHVHEILCAPWQPDTRTAKTPARTARAFEK